MVGRPRLDLVNNITFRYEILRAWRPPGVIAEDSGYTVCSVAAFWYVRDFHLLFKRSFSPERGLLLRQPGNPNAARSPVADQTFFHHTDNLWRLELEPIVCPPSLDLHQVDEVHEVDHATSDWGKIQKQSFASEELN